jgi:ParB/RepB/Spo0J family partition protein
MEDRIIAVEISTLRPHARQHEFFADLPADQFNELVEDIRRNGQRNPIRILPDHTIVCGHERVRAAQELGRSHIDAIVVDITDENAIVRLLVEDNLNRRHVGPIGLARIYVALSQARSVDRHGTGSVLRQQIARRISRVSGRTLDRYRTLLRLPRVIQEAIESGMLSISAGQRLAKIPKVVRDKIEAEIKAGAPVKQVVLRHLKRSGRQTEVVDLRAGYRQFFGSLRKTMCSIGGRIKDVAGFGPESDEAITLAEAGTKFLAKIANEEKKIKAMRRANSAGLFGSLVPSRSATNPRRARRRRSN